MKQNSIDLLVLWNCGLFWIWWWTSQFMKGCLNQFSSCIIVEMDKTCLGPHPKSGHELPTSKGQCHPV